MVKVDYITESQIKTNAIEGINNAEESYKRGVQNPRRNPMEAAVKAIMNGTWEKNFRASVEKWVTKLGKVSVEDIKAAALAAASTYADRAAGKGAENWGKYYEKAKPTIEAAATELVNSPQSKEDFIKFYEKMHTLTELK